MPTTAVPRTFGDAGRMVLKELGAFGVVGLACFVLDLALFHLLYAEAGLDAVAAKLLATLVSMTAAFLGHRYWSFARRGRTGIRKGYLLFTAVNGATLGLGLAIVATARHGLGLESALALQAANVVSIAIGTGIRWLCYRRWVFPAVGPPAHGAAQLPRHPARS